MPRYIDAEALEERCRKLDLPSVPYSYLASAQTIAARPDVKAKWIKSEDGSLQCSLCGCFTNDMFDIIKKNGEELAELMKAGGETEDLMLGIQYPQFCGKCGAEMTVIENEGF